MRKITLTLVATAAALFLLLPWLEHREANGDRARTAESVPRTTTEGSPLADLPEPVDRDLDAIRADGRLVMLTRTDSTSFFLYRGAFRGFEYELLRRFARQHDLELDVEVARGRHALFEKLQRGEGDVVASRLSPKRHETREVAFTIDLYRTPPRLVQRSDAEMELPQAAEIALDGAAPAASTSTTVPARLVRRRQDLVGERVQVPEGSRLVDRLLEIEAEEGGDIEIVEVDEDSGYETLIRAVASGRYRLTAAPGNIADLKASYYSNLTVVPTLGPPLRVAWAVRRNGGELHRALDEFLENARGEDWYRELYERYFEDRRGYQELIDSDYLSSETSRLSPWDDLIRAESARVGWDWRLLASQIYQESSFNPRARSWAGARGLMQLMPRTAAEHGVRSPYDPVQSLRGGRRHIEWLQRYWGPRIDEDDERLRFILGSYNAGHGHVEDARRLAHKNGDDPDHWQDVSYWLLQLSKRPVYTDPVVRYGFVRGLEPVTYVDRILRRWEHYQQLVRPEDRQA